MRNRDFLACQGTNCALKMTCRKYHNWIEDDDSILTEITPRFSKETGCDDYNQIEFCGN